ncbi:MAG: ParB/RepB/Spo0J family partition protein [Alphaproteobacteria bacterium]|nr:ParB/RepB/Spo0J family partition protein [Alphaproteobacteria bacterium]
MSTKEQKESIGRGINSLLRSIENPLINKPNLQASDVASTHRISIDKISPNPSQPRKYFDENALLELVESIKMHDLIQPITVVKNADDTYQLISGERRWRASKLAGLRDIPAYIRKANDNEKLEFALLENMQREDLNPIEVALCLSRMIEDLNYTQEDIAKRMGKDRTLVSHYIRLLKLPPDIQDAVRKNTITMGHAKALITSEDIEKQLFIFQEILSKNLNVRQTEQLAKNVNQKPLANKPQPINKEDRLNPVFKKIEDKLCYFMETKVTLNHQKNGSGTIDIYYNSIAELNNLLDKLKIQAN